MTSYEVGRRVTTLPSPVGVATACNLQTRTLVLDVSHVRGLNSAEYRVGDLTKSFFRAVSGDEKLLQPYARVTLVSKGVSVKTRATTSDSRGNAQIGETVLLPAPLGSGQEILEFAVYNKVGLQSKLRGDPLIGSVSMPISSLSARDVELTLVRDGKPRGQLHISRVVIEARPDRELTLAKAALITSVVGTHWGLAIGSGVHEMVAVGAANGGPTALLGPTGLIAHTIAASDWVEWKMALVAQRARGGAATRNLLSKVEICFRPLLAAGSWTPISLHLTETSAVPQDSSVQRLSRTTSAERRSPTESSAASWSLDLSTASMRCNSPWAHARFART